MDRQPDHRRRVVAVRSTLVAGFGAIGGVLAHFVGGGSLPASSAGIVAVSALAVLATGSAARVARCTRGPWMSWAVLLVGQVAMEAVLRPLATPSSPLPPWAAVLHVVTAVVLTALLLGGERVAGDLLDLLDRWVPRSWVTLPIVEVVANVACVAIVSTSLGTLERHPRAPRGPPPG